MITFSAAGTIDVGTLSSHGRDSGGSIGVIAGTVSARRLSVRGRDMGGTITVASTVGDLFVRKVDASASRDTGGSIFLTSSADLTVNGSASVQGDLTGGEMRFAANGNMTLDGGSFDARGASGRATEGLAGGDLAADGKFKAAVGGCIGFAAGRTLDTSAASFDVALSAGCP